MGRSLLIRTTILLFTLAILLSDAQKPKGGRGDKGGGGRGGNKEKGGRGGRGAGAGKTKQNKNYDRAAYYGDNGDYDNRAGDGQKDVDADYGRGGKDKDYAYNGGGDIDYGRGADYDDSRGNIEYGNRDKESNIIISEKDYGYDGGNIDYGNDRNDVDYGNKYSGGSDKGSTKNTDYGYGGGDIGYGRGGNTNYDNDRGGGDYGNTYGGDRNYGNNKNYGGDNGSNNDKGNGYNRANIDNGRKSNKGGKRNYNTNTDYTYNRGIIDNGRGAGDGGGGRGSGKTKQNKNYDRGSYYGDNGDYHDDKDNNDHNNNNDHGYNDNNDDNHAYSGGDGGHYDDHKDNEHSNDKTDYGRKYDNDGGRDYGNHKDNDHNNNNDHGGDHGHNDNNDDNHAYSGDDGHYDDHKDNEHSNDKTDYSRKYDNDGGRDYDNDKDKKDHKPNNYDNGHNNDDNHHGHNDNNNDHGYDDNDDGYNNNNDDEYNNNDVDDGYNNNEDVVVHSAPNPVPYSNAIVGGTTVVDIALSSDDFSILVTALTTANLVDALSSSGPFTVFAPTNDAFIALITALGITAEELLAIPSLGDILLYHVVSGYLLSEDLARMSSVTTLNGQTIDIEGEADSLTLISQQGGTSNIIAADLEASNGVVHVVDAVLLPLFDTVIEIAKSFEDFSLLVAALDHAGLTETLEGPGPFTVFAPPNSAFEALMTALGIGVDELLAIPSLPDILLYHVIGNFLLTKDLLLYDGQHIATLTSDGQTVEIDADSTAIAVLDQQGGTANIVLPDVQAKNGVVHVIDSVLLPLFDTVLEIAQSFEAFSILVTAVEVAGLEDALTSEGPFTVMAPNNAAFEILLEALDVTLEDILKMPTLQEILLYHVIGDFLLTDDLVTQNDGRWITLKPDGQTIQVLDEDGTIKVVDQQQGLTGIAEIILPNVQAKNGVAHVINRVLLPLFDTVVQIAASFDKFSILVAAVEKAGLTEVLMGDGPFTVFAPPNDAFIQLMKEIHIDINDLLNIPQLRDILLYHVVGDFLLREELASPKDGKTSSIKTLKPDGQTVKAADVKSGTILIDAHSDVSQIGLSDVRAKNGVAHVIDRILVPLFDSVVQVATSFKDYSILVKLVQAADMIHYLQGPGPFTVFAPNNKAFDDLMHELRVDLDDLIRLPTLKRVLKYHILGKYLLAKDLETRNYETLSGQTLHINTDKFDKQKAHGFVVDGIQVTDQQDMKTDVLFGNVEAFNGAVHVIQRVMIPMFDDIMQIAESFDDYSILVRLVRAAGIENELRKAAQYTVFAPNNKAFGKLMYELEINVDDLVRLPNLREVLWYHINPHWYFTHELDDEKELKQEVGQTLYVMTDGHQNMRRNGFDAHGICLRDQQHNHANVIIGNVQARNGIVHVIDDVLMWMFDTVVQIGYSIQDYSILMRSLEITGLIPLYSGPGPFTVLAPNDWAFNKLMADLLIDLDILWSEPFRVVLRETLMTNVVWGYYLESDLKRMDMIQTTNPYGQWHRVLSHHGSSGSHGGYGNSNNHNGNSHAGGGNNYHHNNNGHRRLGDHSSSDGNRHSNNNNQHGSASNDHKSNDHKSNDQNGHSSSGDHKSNDHNNNHHNDYHCDGGDNEGFAVHDVGTIDPQNDFRPFHLGNVEARNGVVFAHYRSHVPVFSDIMKVARSIPRDYSILVHLVEVAGLNPILSDPSAGPFTVFAPNNIAFHILMDELLIDIEDLENLPNLPEVIWYHILGRYLVTPQLARAEITMHDAQEIWIQDNGNSISNRDALYDVRDIFTTDQQHDPAAVIIGNVMTMNGVIHVVDRVRILLFDSIVQIAASLKDYSILTQLVYAAGIDDMLIAPGAYTVFAPNNAAFEKLFAELRITLDDLLRMPLLKDALFNHIMNAFIYSSDLPDGPVVNLLNQNVYIDRSNYGGNGYNGFAVRGIQCTDMQSRSAYTLLGNVEAKNGIVHVIDRVLIFLFDTVVDIATSFDDYSILVQLVVAADLLDTLSGPGPFTVFAPNNDAFYRLMEELHITIDDLLNLPNLADVLLYHILDDNLLSTQLPTGDTETINGQTVYIDKDNYDGYVGGFDITGIQLTDQQSDTSNIFIGNVQANNGVVFVIDRVMIPLFDSVVQVATSLDDYSILVELVVEAGLAEVLSGPGPFTVFAPNNEAFYKLMDELLIDLDDILNIPSLKEILLYHVVNDYLLTADLSTGPLETINGQTFYVNTGEGRGSYSGRRILQDRGAGDEITKDIENRGNGERDSNDTYAPYGYDDDKMYEQEGFVVTDTTLTDQQQRATDVFIGNVETANGVVFVIDRVMVPMFDNIVHIATSFDDYSILVQLVIEAGLVDTLINDGPFTVFAPNNDAFYKLMDELRITINDLLKLPILKEVLLYHALNGYYISTDLSTGLTETVYGQSVYINTDRYDGYTDGFDVVGISLTDGQYQASNVFIGNVHSQNGVVFVVDRVMVPLFDSIVQIATSFDDYSILVQLVVAAGLADILSDPTSGPFTVFAPNNYAFYKLMDELEITIDDLLNMPNLADVLLYHVISGEYSSLDLTTGNYTTLHGQSIFIDTDNYDGVDRGFQLIGISVTDSQARDAYTIIGNVLAQNGIVHVIDAVLLPMFETVVDIATSLEDFSILVSAVQHANLVDALVGAGPFTVFAPHNDAFEELMSKLGITVFELLNLPNLAEVLLYHVVSDYIPYQGLAEMSSLTTLQGQTLQIETNDAVVTLIDQQGQIAVIDPADVQAKNGIVHVIDTVLLPLFDTIVDIATSLDAFSILVAALTEADLTGALAASGPFTVFAPTNTAFNDLMDLLGLSLDELLQLDILKDVLLYHVVENHLYTKDGLIDLSAYNGVTITTMNGETLSPQVFGNTSSEVVIVSANGAMSNILIPDVFAQNGVVHVIDRVLLPPFDTVIDIASAFDEFSILVAAVEKAGLTEALQSSGPFTIFAPTNTAFLEFLQSAGMTVDDLLDADELAHILLYHCIDGHMYTIEGLMGLSVYNGATIMTKSGETIEPQIVDDGYVILHDNNGDAANIVIPDVVAKNGIVQVIDSVLLPFPRAIDE